MSTLPEVPPSFSVKNKTILISGSSRGLGLNLARGLSSAGANVIGVSRSSPPSNTQFSHYLCDINDGNAFASVAKECFGITGTIDGYLHVAGISRSSTDGFQEHQVFVDAINTNLVAAYECCRIVAQYMQRQRSGSIVIVTSIGAHLGFPGNPGYVASKGGLRMLSKALAADLGRFNIRVNSLAPGYFHTKMTNASYMNPELHHERARKTMLGRWGREEELLGAAVFLLSEASSYMTGADLIVDGGWTAKGL